MSVWKRDAVGRLVRIEHTSNTNVPNINVVDFDEEFCQILDDLRKYKKQAPEEMAKNPDFANSNSFNSYVMDIAYQIRNNDTINKEAKVKYIGCLSDILSVHNHGVSNNEWDNSTSESHHIPCDGSSFHKRNVDCFEYNQNNLSLIIRKLHLGCCFINVIQDLIRMHATDSIIDEIKICYMTAINALGLKTLPSPEGYYNEEGYNSDNDNSALWIQKKNEVDQIVSWIMHNQCNNDASQILPNKYPHNITFAQKYKIRNDYSSNALKKIYEAELDQTEEYFGRCGSNRCVDFDGDLISMVGTGGYKFRLPDCRAYIFERKNNYKEKCILYGMEGFLSPGSSTFCDAKDNKIWVCGGTRIKGTKNIDASYTRDNNDYFEHVLSIKNPQQIISTDNCIIAMKPCNRNNVIKCETWYKQNLLKYENEIWMNMRGYYDTINDENKYDYDEHGFKVLSLCCTALEYDDDGQNGEITAGQPCDATFNINGIEYEYEDSYRKYTQWENLGAFHVSYSVLKESENIILFSHNNVFYSCDLNEAKIKQVYLGHKVQGIQLPLRQLLTEYHMVISYDSSLIKVWDTRTNKAIMTLQGNKGGRLNCVLGFEVSGNSFIASGGGYHDESVLMWDLRSNNSCLYKIKPPQNEGVDHIAWHNNSRSLILSYSTDFTDRVKRYKF